MGKSHVLNNSPGQPSWREKVVSHSVDLMVGFTWETKQDAVLAALAAVGRSCSSLGLKELFLRPLLERPQSLTRLIREICQLAAARQGKTIRLSAGLILDLQASCLDGKTSETKQKPVEEFDARQFGPQAPGAHIVRQVSGRVENSVSTGGKRTRAMTKRGFLTRLVQSSALGDTRGPGGVPAPAGGALGKVVRPLVLTTKLSSGLSKKRFAGRDLETEKSGQEGVQTRLDYDLQYNMRSKVGMRSQKVAAENRAKLLATKFKPGGVNWMSSDQDQNSITKLRSGENGSMKKLPEFMQGDDWKAAYRVTDVHARSNLHACDNDSYRKHKR